MYMALPTLIGALTLLMVGCVAHNSGVTPAGMDTYMVSRQAATPLAGASTLKAEALREADQHCTSQHRLLKVVKATEAQPPYVLGNYPKAEVEFMCLAADDPRLQIR
jgi:hypothetical protein